MFNSEKSNVKKLCEWQSLRIIQLGPAKAHEYSYVSIKNIDILPNRQYIANTADSAQEQYS
jgi:hypothetical protein